MKLCECGCGREVSKIENEYINGHYFRGKKFSKIHIKKLKISWTEERIKKQKLLYFGKNNPMYGIIGKENPTFGEKNGMFGRTSEKSPMYGRKGKKHPMWRKHHTKEAKEKQRLARLGKKRLDITGEKHPMWGKTHAKKTIEKIRLFRSKQIFPFRDSKPELKIQGFLKELNIEFIKHSIISIKHYYQCDIFIPALNLIIECDGDFFHCNPEKYSADFIRFPKKETKTAKDIWERDKIRTEELKERGYKVLRIWGSEIKKMDVNEFKRVIEI